MNPEDCPTKEQILEKEIKFRKSTIRVVSAWKHKCYTDGKWRHANQNDALRGLISSLAANYRHPVIIRFKPGIEPHYDELNRTICLNSNRSSIITALHEFAHHILNGDELATCRWSVWLFKKQFPTAYSRLTWNNHMLIKT